MTDKTKNRVEIALIAAIVSVVSAFSVTQYRVGQLEEDVKEIRERVTAIYCSSVTEPQRGACR